MTNKEFKAIDKKIVKRIPTYELKQTGSISVREGDFLGATASSTQAVADIFRKLLDGAGVEEFWVLTLDTRRKITGAQKVSQGSLTQTLTHPREVMRLAVSGGACGLIVCHNHPSGDCAPSADDNSITRRLKEAGELLAIPLMDHIILGEGTYYSYRENDFKW